METGTTLLTLFRIPGANIWIWTAFILILLLNAVACWAGVVVGMWFATKRTAIRSVTETAAAEDNIYQDERNYRKKQNEQPVDVNEYNDLWNGTDEAPDTRPTL